jgi:hypothetical protein
MDWRVSGVSIVFVLPEERQVVQHKMQGIYRTTKYNIRGRYCMVLVWCCQRPASKRKHASNGQRHMLKVECRSALQVLLWDGRGPLSCLWAFGAAVGVHMDRLHPSVMNTRVRVVGHVVHGGPGSHQWLVDNQTSRYRRCKQIDN